MRLSAILVSVNIVAALPVAAQAGQEAVSDKAEWLKQNLAAMGQAPRQEPRKISLSDAGAPGTPKVRNFAPNRRLPRRIELEQALVAQRARLDVSSPAVSLQALTPRTDGPLTGQISAYAIASQPAVTACRVAPPAKPSVPVQPAPQAVPGKVATLPGQVSRFAAAPLIPVIPEPPPAPTPPGFPQPVPALASSPAGSRASVDRAADGGAGVAERVIRQSGALLVQAPVLKPDEQAMVDQLVELNRPGRSPQFQDLPGSPAVSCPPESGAVNAGPPSHPAVGRQHRDIGPPPFPLNLLPEDALKDFVRGGARCQADAPPAYFGSWHSQSNLSCLPPAGFHSFIPARRTLGSTYSRYAPVARSLAPASRAGTACRPGRAPLRWPEASGPRLSSAQVLVYPPYQGYRASCL